ncbi:MAG: 2-oxo-4-hydroxy-4-carboxy-5-ureidoimidazoline decarboxylase [Vulcanimicrobiota bacterium]
MSSSSNRDYQEARLQDLNSSTESALGQLFKQVCHSQRWADEMVRSAPFQDLEDLLAKGARAWSECEEKDWMEALDGHPRIGQKASGSSLSAKWSAGEQAAAKSPDQQVLDELAEAQQNYFEKFGFIFLICASGRSSHEILAAAKERLNHSRSEEIQKVADEQAKIIHLRLEKLLTS